MKQINVCTYRKEKMMWGESMLMELAHGHECVSADVGAIFFRGF